MPFIGQDWRSPGEVWIKTVEGWEPMKLLRKSHFVRHQNDCNLQQNSQQEQQQQQNTAIYNQDHQATTETKHNLRPGSSTSSSSSSVSCSLSPSSSCSSQTSNYAEIDDVVVDELGVLLPSSSSSPPLLDSATCRGRGSVTSSNATSSSDSDSEGESMMVVGGGSGGVSVSKPVPVPGKARHQSGDSATSGSSISSISSCADGSSSPSEMSVVDIIQRLQRSSSQPIPMDILKESSEQIEIYHTQPYYRITLNPTREVQGSNIISDAFYRLDFCNAIRDIRRFAYVSKLLHLLITQNLTSLSGNATKALFWMLEEIAKQVASNKQNIHVIRELLVELREIVDKYLCWGRPLGSTSLWEQHLATLERICEMTDAIEIVPPEHPGKPTWSELPEELIREILLRLSDYKDLERSAQACQRMNSLLNEEQHIWKQLVKYHFTKDQLRWALRTMFNAKSNDNKHNQLQKATNAIQITPNVIEDLDLDDLDLTNGNFNSNQLQKPLVDWEQLFHLLRKKFGLKEEYADCLFLCRYCRCLFWKSKNHPCILENPELTRQVLVTSPLTGFTSQQNPTSRKFTQMLKNRNQPSSPSSSTTTNSQIQMETLSPSSSSSRSGERRQSAGPSSSSVRILHHSSSVPANNSISSQRRLPPIPIQSGSGQGQHRQMAAAQPNPLPAGPVMVQNIPFFEHPLVIQRRNQIQQNRPANDDNNNVEQRATKTNFRSATKAPLHVPITPQAFLKFFSL